MILTKNLAMNSNSEGSSVSTGRSYSSNDSLAHLKCSACDPESNVAHLFQISRFRIANLCCAGEERLIHSSLSEVKGIEKIEVNIVGRYCIVKHCPMACCAPPLRIIELLNKKHLGASIQEVTQHTNSQEGEAVSIYRQLHAVIVAILLAVGVCTQYYQQSIETSRWCYVGCIFVGAVPVCYAAWVAVRRRHLDINILMIIALFGALGVGEYFDGSLLITLVLVSDLVEAFILTSVRRVVQQTSAAASPQQAFLASGESKSASSLKIMDVLAVRAGEMILGDGVVVDGEGVVDESALTGESMPRNKGVGSRALSGTVVQNGYLEVGCNHVRILILVR
jgi:Cd2+/Zn2+-exporting ATPase